MKARTRRDSRLLALFGLLAVLPLAIWACADAGDAPSAPSGPNTKYDPRMDQRGATITAVASNPSWIPGGTYGIAATFRDGNGSLVEGAPLWISTEASFHNPAFAFNTNPTVTDGNGTASIKVSVPGDCPNDSYAFRIASFPGGPTNGPMAQTFVHIVVRSDQAETIDQPPAPSGPTAVDQGTAVSYFADGNLRTSLGHPVQYKFLWGDGTESAWTSAPFQGTHAWSAGGTYDVRVLARCAIDQAVLSVVSLPLSVVVTAESVSVPNAPTGNNPIAALTDGNYTATGSSSTLGHPIQYQLDFGDGTTSTWFTTGTVVTHQWPSAGTRPVTAKARCQTHTSVLSGNSSPLNVVVQ